MAIVTAPGPVFIHLVWSGIWSQFGKRVWSSRALIPPTSGVYTSWNMWSVLQLRVKQTATWLLPDVFPSTYMFDFTLSYFMWSLQNLTIVCSNENNIEELEFGMIICQCWLWLFFLALLPVQEKFELVEWGAGVSVANRAPCERHHICCEAEATILRKSRRRL